MDERRRFQVALGGVASTVLIAALFVVSGPRSTPPLVPPPAALLPLALQVQQGLPTQEPPRPAVAGRRPPRDAHPRRFSGAGQTFSTGSMFYAPAAQTSTPADVVAAEASTRDEQPVPARLPSHVTVLPIVASPTTSGARIVSPGDTASRDHDGHGPVASAFVAAGKEVGRGFRTAGRAIKLLKVF